uniref:Uncharacterized protein n=1 Tax=Anguilla anguilla TaxID=7936 RepID=A0A0E9T246_ANGAN
MKTDRWLHLQSSLKPLRMNLWGSSLSSVSLSSYSCTDIKESSKT